MSDSDELPRILLVDDEPNVLEGLERTLFGDFGVSTALSGAAGLEAIGRDGPFAVVVSDMRMPEMNGAAFLARVQQAAPDTVRVLLTGQADMDSAIAAVNEGNIFRFLCKPCPQDVLFGSLEAAVKQYQLTTAERDLLENTLKGAVKVLTEILSLASPVAFSRSDQVKALVAHMAEQLQLEDRWSYEVAGMLSHIGCIALPPDTLEKAYAGQPITPDEKSMLDDHPEVGHRLLAHIPRLGGVAMMIRGQNDPATTTNEEERMGAEILRVALAVDRLMTAGSGVRNAVNELRRKGGYEEPLLAAIWDFQGEKPSEVVRALGVRELQSFMVLDEDVFAKNGNVLAPKGRELTNVLVERLKNWERGIGIVEPIRVRVPQAGA